MQQNSGHSIQGLFKAEYMHEGLSPLLSIVGCVVDLISGFNDGKTRSGEWRWQWQ